jgi:menaquinone-dependent protoporphyrinogen oxidase
MTVNVLVAYASKHGSTHEIADVIGDTIHEALGEADATVEVSAAHLVRDISGYDAIVLGSALYAAHWQREANRFVARHREELARRPVWLFSSGPLDRSADAGVLPATPAVAHVIAAIDARDHRTFGGRLLPDTPGLDPQILATHPTGDFRDWVAIRAWAVRIADELKATGAVAADLSARATPRPG